MKRNLMLPAVALTLAGCSTFSPTAALNDSPWRELAAVGGGTQTQLAISHWPYDKYPEIPQLTPKSKTVLLDVDGPGVVTLFHVSKYAGGDQGALTLRVWFDGYTDIQWEKVKHLPADTGYLRVVYRTGTPTIPRETIEVCNLGGPGAIVAHWLQLQANDPRTISSDFICEANQRTAVMESIDRIDGLTTRTNAAA
jgi:hypothetical protein